MELTVDIFFSKTMTLQKTTQKIFTFSAVATLAGATSWVNAVSPALAEVNNSNYVCYLYGSDGQQYDLSDLCGVSETGTQADKTAAEEMVAEEIVAEETVVEDEGETTEAIAPTDSPTRPTSLIGTDNTLPTIENTTRLLAAPEPTDS